MEYKVRKESQTLLEKVFHANEKNGVVESILIPSILKEFNPDIAYDPEDLKNTLALHDVEGSGLLDYDSFTRIVLHYLLKQTRRESNEFGHKNLISLPDFVGP